MSRILTQSSETIYENNLDKDICNEAKFFIEHNKNKFNETSYLCDVLTSNNLTRNILKYKELQNLHLLILKEIQNYMFSINSYFCGYIVDSWFNIYKKDFYQEFHNHLDPIIRSICGIVYFDNSNFETEFFLENRLKVKPEFSKIVIFHDTVYHRAILNKENEERITLAFNYKKCE